MAADQPLSGKTYNDDWDAEPPEPRSEPGEPHGVPAPPSADELDPTRVRFVPPFGKSCTRPGDGLGDVASFAPPQFLAGRGLDGNDLFGQAGTNSWS